MDVSIKGLLPLFTQVFYVNELFGTSPTNKGFRTIPRSRSFEVLLFAVFTTVQCFHSYSSGKFHIWLPSKSKRDTILNEESSRH